MGKKRNMVAILTTFSFPSCLHLEPEVSGFCPIFPRTCTPTEGWTVWVNPEKYPGNSIFATPRHRSPWRDRWNLLFGSTSADYREEKDSIRVCLRHCQLLPYHLMHLLHSGLSDTCPTLKVANTYLMTCSVILPETFQCSITQQMSNEVSHRLRKQDLSHRLRLCPRLDNHVMCMHVGWNELSSGTNLAGCSQEVKGN